MTSRTAHLVSFALVLLAFASTAWGQAKPERPQPIAPEEGERLGRALVAELISRAPEVSARTNTLRIEDAAGDSRKVQVIFETQTTSNGWTTSYQAVDAGAAPTTLVVLHQPGKPNVYRLEGPNPRSLSADELMTPFAGSDFWYADLGLEFLRWPRQVVLKQEMRKSQACDVLESTNPSPTPTGYSRVVSWVDRDSGGIVHADAYDAAGRILKRFEPSEVQKVDGKFQVKEIRMSNRKTNTRSWVIFDLGKG